ncbi:aggrecan core protein-like isoform X2 [Xyrauchen texanus]|uniref:aggrecan core protein-like isoform X2 n=1 Tax=Xyrauchen texanus TaxID=154827 RepID=UPI0022421CF0|nr:aggrecan core protein-like isoform X2 [Xyrauchen texanus]
MQSLLLLIICICISSATESFDEYFYTEPESTLSVSIPIEASLEPLMGDTIVLPCYFQDNTVNDPGATNIDPLSHRIKWSLVTKDKTTNILVASEGIVNVDKRYLDRVSMVGYPLTPTDATIKITELHSNDSGVYRCEVMQGIENNHDLVYVQVQGIVFHYRAITTRYTLTFEKAKAACIQNSAVIATPDQLQAAFDEGYHQCDAGWLADQSVRYPIHDPREACYGNKYEFPGVRTYGVRDVNETYDVYCFAEKMKGKVLHKTSPIKFTFKEAEAECIKYGAQLATTGQLYVAWKGGMDVCNAGWLADRSVRYPINTARPQCGGGLLGVRTVYLFPNQTGYPHPDSRYNAFCYSEKDEEGSGLLDMQTTTEAGGGVLSIGTFTDSPQIFLRPTTTLSELQGKVVTHKPSMTTSVNLSYTELNVTQLPHLLPPSSIEVNTDVVEVVTNRNGSEISRMNGTEAIMSAAGVVFHYRSSSSRYAFNFVDAQLACQSIGAVIASPQQLQTAYEAGYHQCDAGWLLDQTVRYPVVSPREKCSGDLEHVPGVRSYGMRPADEQYDVYCYVDKLRGEVFHASSFEGFTYDEAVDYCQGQNASLASTGDLYAAWKQGFDKCRAGWLLDRSVRYSINNPRQQCGRGKAGVHTVYMFPNQTGSPDLHSKLDAYCFKAHLDMSLNESEPNITVTEEQIVNITTFPSLLRPGSGSSRINGTDDLLGSGSGDQPSGLSGSNGYLSGSGSSGYLSGSGSSGYLSGSGSSGYLSGSGSSGYLSGSGSSGYLSGSGSSGDISGSGISGDGSDILVTFSGSDIVVSGDGFVSGRPEEAGEGSTEILTFPSGLFGMDFSGSGSGSGSGYSSEESGSTSDVSSSSGESCESGGLSSISSGTSSSEESSDFNGFSSGVFPFGGFSGISLVDGSDVIMVDTQWEKVSIVPSLTEQELGRSHVDFSGSGQISVSGVSGGFSAMSGDHSGSGSGSAFSGLTFLGPGFIDLLKQSREQEASGVLSFGSGEGSGFTSGGDAIESGKRSEASASGDITLFTSGAMMEMSNKPFQGMELGQGDVEYSRTVRLSSESGDDKTVYSSGKESAKCRNVKVCTMRKSKCTCTAKCINVNVKEYKWTPTTGNTPKVNSSDAASALLSAEGPSGQYSDAAGPVHYSEPKGIFIKLDAITSAPLSSTKDPAISLQIPSITESHVVNASVNPCDPNPCGAGSCSVQDGVGLCHCPPGLRGEECRFDVHSCEEGWTKFQGNCYLHLSERETWMDSEQRCRDLNAHLVSIITPEEQAFINSFAQDYQWIGLNDKTVENDFRWSDGTPLQYENWRLYQPDNYFNSGEDCVVMIWHLNGQWNDVPCNYHLPFTCKTGPVSCDQPPKVENAKMYGNKKERYQVNSIIRYQCHENFTQRHLPVIRCMADGQWEKPQVECIAKINSRPQKKSTGHHSHKANSTTLEKGL